MTLIIPYAFYRKDKFLAKLPDVIRSFRRHQDKPTWRYEFTKRIILAVEKVHFEDEDGILATGWKLEEQDELVAA